MHFATLDEWLAWQEQLHPVSIELGLDRVRAVLDRLSLQAVPFRVLTVGGTNGKGSVAHHAAAMLQAAGDRVGLYTSPHILRYNERIRVDGDCASDAAICAAFEQVEQARGDTSLTYFEFGSLAALVLFRDMDIDTAVLEVGLGGRLDAVNAVDADAAVVVSLGLDHTDWLGDSLDMIAREKAGIFRRGRPAIVGPGAAIPALRKALAAAAAVACIAEEDFQWQQDAGEAWSWQGAGREFQQLPLAGLDGGHRLANAATAIAAVTALQADIDSSAVAAGLRQGGPPARLERRPLPGERELVLDVGHNVAAAEALAASLAADPRPTQAVLGMLADKDASGFVQALAQQVSGWHLAGLDGPRGQTAAKLARRLPASIRQLGSHADTPTAVRAALAGLPAGGRLLVCGSFQTIGDFEASGLYSTFMQASDRSD